MSGAGRYRYLFSPLRIGPVVVRNRIVFSAHLTNYAEDGLPTQQHADYYAARAAGGVGLIITEEHSTHPTDWPYEKLIHGFHRAVIPGYQKMTAAAHGYGVPIFAQLNHNGGQASSMFSRLPVWAPSPVPDPMFREVPKAVERHEIAQIVAGYGTVAGHCAEGGFDGVELQCSHSSIVRGFLSPATNKRTDGYGGSLAARARILLEIVDAVREAIGPDRALGVRICGDELIEGGSTLADAVEVAKMMEATGQVDYINTSIGVATATLFMIEASMSIPPGYALYIANAMRRAVSLPVIGVGRIKDPVQAERALADGHCDLVGVVRGQIADPDFAAKARSGHATEIRTCLSCNQECVGRMGLNRWLGCIENPRTGREAVPLPPPSRRGRRVIVVGGGPACRRPPPRPIAVIVSRCSNGSCAPAARWPRPRRCHLVPSSSTWSATSRPSASATGWRSGPAWPPPRHGCAVSHPTPWCWRPERGRSRRTGPPGCPASSTCATCSKAGPSRPARWSWSTTSASIRPPASPSCWPTVIARWRSLPPAWWWARISASPSTWRPSTCGRMPRESARPPTWW